MKFKLHLSLILFLLNKYYQFNILNKNIYLINLRKLNSCDNINLINVFFGLFFNAQYNKLDLIRR